VQNADKVSVTQDNLQIMFCFIFAAELCLRMFSNFRRFCTHDCIWNVLDAVTVISSCIEVGITLARVGHAQTYHDFATPQASETSSCGSGYQNQCPPRIAFDGSFPHSLSEAFDLDGNAADDLHLYICYHIHAECAGWQQ